MNSSGWRTGAMVGMTVLMAEAETPPANKVVVRRWMFLKTAILRYCP